jgi:hypothetical protein
MPQAAPMRNAVLVATSLAVTPVFTQSPSRAVTPGPFDPARAAVIDRAPRRYVDTDRVPGIVALVAAHMDRKYRVDPTARLTMVMMIQLNPNQTDLSQVFPSLVYRALR